MKQLLVYGSLRRNHINHRLISHLSFLGTVRLSMYDLFHVGWFPGIVFNPENEEGVSCELYKLPEGFDITPLDYLEGFDETNPKGSLFFRQDVYILGEPTYVYVYNQPLREGTPKIESGDWNDV